MKDLIMDLITANLDNINKIGQPFIDLLFSKKLRYNLDLKPLKFSEFQEDILSSNIQMEPDRIREFVIVFNTRLNEAYSVDRYFDTFLKEKGANKVIDGEKMTEFDFV